MKICLKCKLLKSIHEFGTKKRNSDGKRGRCKECEKEDRIIYLSSSDNIEKTKKSQKIWRKKNIEKERIRNREYHKNNKEKIFIYARKRLLLKEYGMTIEQYNAMLIAQNYKCKICLGEKPGRTNSNFYVDHCHKTGIVRGLLCTHCNMAIGQFNDEVTRIRRAADYVENNGNI